MTETHLKITYEEGQDVDDADKSNHYCYFPLHVEMPPPRWWFLLLLRVWSVVVVSAAAQLAAHQAYDSHHHRYTKQHQDPHEPVLHRDVASRHLVKVAPDKHQRFSSKSKPLEIEMILRED